MLQGGTKEHNMKTGVIGGVLAFAVAAGISSAAQAGAASYTINITGYVPVICRVNAANTEVQPGQNVDLGNLTEFCNNPTDYQVWVDYAPGITGETIYVDGNAIPLSASGSTMIDSSSTAASLVRSLSLSGDDQPTSLSLRVVPI